MMPLGNLIVMGLYYRLRQKVAGYEVIQQRQHLPSEKVTEIHQRLWRAFFSITTRFGLNYER